MNRYAEICREKIFYEKRHCSNNGTIGATCINVALGMRILHSFDNAGSVKKILVHNTEDLPKARHCQAKSHQQAYSDIFLFVHSMCPVCIPTIAQRKKNTII